VARAEKEQDEMAKTLADELGALTQSAGGRNDGLLGGLNLKDVQDNGGGVLIPEGQEVNARIEKVAKGTSKAGNTKYDVRVKVTAPAVYKGKVIFDTVTITDAALWRVKGLMRATDLLSEDGADFLGDSEQSFVGKEVGFKVKVDSYHKEGEKEPRLSNKIDGGYKEPFDFDEEGDASAPDFG
jgi:hypothetical protein